MSSDLLDAFLGASDLDELAATYDVLPDRVDPDRVAAVVAAWSPPQAVANLLMHPTVMPPERRVPAILRGLRDEGYARLAASVGVGRLAATDLTEDGRRALLDALLDVVATDAGPAGVRAAAEIGPLVRAPDLPLVEELAEHPVPEVRHNLAQARRGVADPSSREPVLLPYLPNLADYPG